MKSPIRRCCCNPTATQGGPAGADGGVGPAAAINSATGAETGTGIIRPIHPRGWERLGWVALSAQAVDCFLNGIRASSINDNSRAREFCEIVSCAPHVSINLYDTNDRKTVNVGLSQPSLDPSTRKLSRTRRRSQDPARDGDQPPSTISGYS